MDEIINNSFNWSKVIVNNSKEEIIKVLNKPLINECSIYYDTPLKNYFFILCIFLITTILIYRSKTELKEHLLFWCYFIMIMMTLTISALLFVK